MSGLEIAAIAGAAASAAGAGVAIHQATQDPPKPPEIPKPIAPPDPRTEDRSKVLRQLSSRSRQNSTILGGYTGSDANVRRPTLLGGGG